MFPVDILSVLDYLKVGLTPHFLQKLNGVDIVKCRGGYEIQEGFGFYQVDKCEYFPCHKNVDENNFNCKFCFCPLYVLDECEGDYSLINGIKDCSNCTIPHNGKEGYEHIIDTLMR